MKEIKAIIQPFMLEHVLDALASIENLPGVTITEVMGWGRSRATNLEKPPPEAGHAFRTKTRLEVVVSDEAVANVVDTIVQAAHTGNPGDGKIFVHPITDVVKIRNGLHGDEAI